MPGQPIDKAVILARGLGTRMRAADASAALTGDQAAVADLGLKAMIPIGRPFLDYVLTILADAGYRQACLVIGPEHQRVRDYYRDLGPRRIEVSFAVQEQPKGTADALLAAEDFAQAQQVAVFNGDNYYPPQALRALREELAGSGLVAFGREGLLTGNIPAERIRQFAIVQTDGAGRMVRIVEKPSPREVAAAGQPVRVSMNCWRFRPVIFQACREVPPSSRGELELPDAAQLALSRYGEPFTVLHCEAPVLDLSSRADVAAVKCRLGGMKVNL